MSQNKCEILFYPRFIFYHPVDWQHILSDYLQETWL